jgi:hypothetical protein
VYFAAVRQKQTRPTLDGQTIHGIEIIQSRLEETTQTDSEKLDDEEINRRRSFRTRRSAFLANCQPPKRRRTYL